MKNNNELLQFVIDNHFLSEASIFSTSGTTGGEIKWVALPREAMESSALAVNKHIGATAKDIWFQPLPRNHVGGNSIYVRAGLSESQVITYDQSPWSVADFYASLAVSKATLCSLVPTQVFDIVKGELRCPASLRAVIIGGAALGESLYLKARTLGWPLLPSFGMTETSSQIATADLESLKHETYPELKLLSHMEASVDAQGFLSVRSPALMTGYILQDKDGKCRFEDPIIDGWFKTEDLVELNGKFLKPLGRGSDVVKISGELVSVVKLESIFAEVLGEVKNQKMAIAAVADERRGSSICIFAEDSVSLATVNLAKEKFNKRVRSFEKIVGVKTVPLIPRTLLGKVIKSKL